MMDLYQMATDSIINSLELGDVPWLRSWCLVNEGAYNRVTGKPYSLLNQMCLSQSGEYASFDQWNEQGGIIKRGSRAERVLYYKKLDAESEMVGKDSRKTKSRFVLRYSNVFHINQVDGVDPLPFKDGVTDQDCITKAEELVKGYVEREGIKLEEALGNQAYYNPQNDTIHIPELSQYKDPSQYYSTLIHEIMHSTGHRNRLNRRQLNETAHFGLEKYSKEELIAEIGSAAILNALGIDSEEYFLNSVSYINNWISKLRNDKRLIVHAASAAEKAVKYVYGVDAVNAANA